MRAAALWCALFALGCRDDPPASPPPPVTPAGVTDGVPLPGRAHVANEIRWPALRSFTYEENAALPADVEALDGREIGMRGFWLYLEDDEYLFVERLWDARSGQPPEVNEAIVVRFAEDRRPLQGCPVIVQGRLSVGEEREDGYVVSLYRMQASSVRLDAARRAGGAGTNCDPAARAR